VEVADDGTIYALSHQIVGDQIPGLNAYDPPYLDDYVEVLSTDGKLLKRVSITKALVDSKYGGLVAGLHRVKFGGQLLHTNTVKPVTTDIAALLPFLKAGEVVVSARDLHALLAIDLNAEKVTWALTGGWRGQHDPDFLPNGRILMFDNWGGVERHGRSRVIEIDPKTSGILWQYAGRSDSPLWSWQRASQQRLPNGNTLITESAAGRILEVTREGDTAWEYVIPVRAGPESRLTPYVMWAQRYQTGYFDFLNH
jgi:hypothetical protein